MDLTYAPYALAFGVGMGLFWSWATGTPIWPIRFDRGRLTSFIASLALFTSFWMFKVAFELQLLVLVAIAVGSWIWNRGRTQPANALRMGADSRR